MPTRRELITAAAGSGVALVFPGLAGTRGMGGGPLAVVTADLESHVVLLDPYTGKTIQRIRTAPGPRSVESAPGPLAIVAHTAAGKLTILHPYEPRASVVVGGLREPRYTAVVDDLAYVTDSAATEIVVVDPRAGVVRGRTHLPGPARHVSASSDGGVLWTALGSKAERLAIVDLERPARPRLRRTIVPPAAAHDVVFAPDGRHVWVTSGTERLVWVYEVGGRRPVAELRADAAPQHVAWVGGRAFVASGESGLMRIYRADGVELERVSIPLGSYNVSYGASRAITPSLERGTVAVLDRRGQILSVSGVARSAHDACITH
ncbi:MAG: WD40 repeat domain-containing protein [Gaiellales bacterium]